MSTQTPFPMCARPVTRSCIGQPPRRTPRESSAPASLERRSDQSELQMENLMSRAAIIIALSLFTFGLWQTDPPYHWEFWAGFLVIAILILAEGYVVKR